MPNPIRWLSVPPLAGLEGQGRGSVGGGGPPGGVLHTLPPASSSAYRTHPHAFVCPYFLQRGCSWGGHPDVDCQGCCGACSSSLSRLFQLPVSGLEDLGVVASGHRPVPAPSLRGHFPLSPGTHPVCSHVSPTGRWPPSIFGRRILMFLCIRNLVASCALWLMAALTDSLSCASVCPRSRRSSLGLLLLYPFFIPWVSVCVVTGTTGSSRHRLGRPSSGISGLSCPFVASWGSWSTRSSPTSLRLRWYIISGWSSTHRLLWLLHRQIASPQRLLLACGSRFWGCCPLCHIWFQGAACGCFRSGFAFTALGIGCILRLRCSGLWTVFGTFGGGFVGIASLEVCLSCRCPQFLPFGPTLQTSAWGLTWVTGLFPACGTSQRLFFLSMPGSCWLCVTVSSTSSPFCQGPRWPCFAAMSPRSPIYSRWGATGLLLSTPLPQGILRWAESLRFRLAPQFLPGIRNVLADSLSRPHQLPSSAWSLNLDVFRSLRHRWPVMFDLCATSDHHRCSIFFSPYRDPLSSGTDAILHSWDGLLACAFLPWSVLPRVLAKLRVSHRTRLTLIAQYWPQLPWFVDLFQLSVDPPVPLSACPDLLFQPRPRRRYPGLHRLALHAWGLSSASPEQLVSPRRWLRRLRWRAVHHRAPPTSSSGRFAGHGAALRATPSRGPRSPRLRIPSGGFDRFGALVSPPSRAIGRCSQWCSSSISLPSLATGFFGTCCFPFGSLLHPTRCVPLPGTS